MFPTLTMGVVLTAELFARWEYTMRSHLLYMSAATLLIAVCFAPAGMAGVPPPPSTGQSADEGANVWGGEHVEMELTKTGADFDFDCAVGTIDQPLALPKDGKFRATGTYTRESPGPTRGDGNRATAAIYVGTIKGDSMQLEIVLVNSKETVGTYELVRGRSGHVMKCR